MYLIAGENNLTITKQNVHRDNGVGLILNIEVARDSITIGALEAIVNDIADNAYEITVYNDSDEKVAILSGFHCEPAIYVKGSVYKVELIDASENAFQIGRHKLMLENLETAATAAAATLTTHANAINKQGEKLTEQEGQVTTLGEMSVSQLDAIDTILTEVFPAAVAEAVNLATEQAVAQVLATLKGETTTEEEYDEEYYDYETGTETEEEAAVDETGTDEATEEAVEA